MLLTDLELDTVDYVANFDNSQKEPSVLPARLPNLLLNGVSGIAVSWLLDAIIKGPKSCAYYFKVFQTCSLSIQQVGMATNIPPHNLGEVVDALCALIHNPNASVSQ